jgi:sugar lactone lactonase YvrE
MSDTAIDAWRQVAAGLTFPEAPRWHDGRLFCSEIFGGRVVAIDDDGRGGGSVEVIAEVPNRPSGLGWLPDGSMLVVSMRDRRVLRVTDDGAIREHADLSSLVRGDCNDMVVDDRGNAYVGSFGYDYAAGEERRASVLVLVTPDGAARVVADDVWFPNGMVVTPDGATLVVAETPAERLTAFTVASDGGLTDRRLFASLDGARPDGIALLDDGTIWIASPGTGELLHVGDDGALLRREPAPGGCALACALGGPRRDTLFVCCSPTHDASEAEHRRGTVLARTSTGGTS